MNDTMSKEQAAEAVQAVDKLSAHLLNAVVGSGTFNPLVGLIRAGMTQQDAEFLRDYLNDATTRDGGKQMMQLIAHFAASCARIAVESAIE